MTTKELIEVVSGIREFVQERDTVLSDEMKRLSADVKKALEFGRESRRASLLSTVGGSNDRPRVRGGKYHGMDMLDLGILRSLANGILADRRSDASQIQYAQNWLERVEGAARALDSETSGAGDDLTFTGMASDLWRDVHLATAVASLIPTVQMPTTPFEIPFEFGDIKWYPGVANTASKSTDPPTNKRTLTAFELAGTVAWSYNLDEDAVIAVLPELRATIVRNAAEVIDDILLNADTSVTNGINSDGATISTADEGKAQWLIGFDGLLHIPLVDNTGQATDVNAALTAALFNANRKAMGKYGVRPSDIAHVVDINTYIKSLTLDEVQTLEKFGPQATILTGQLGAIEGVPLIVAEQMLLADTDGKVTDGATGTTGRILTFNRSQYMKGFVRELLIESERDIQKRQTIMVASFRMAFEGRAANASDTAVALQYDITGV